MAAWEAFDAEPAWDLIARIARGVTIKEVQKALNITHSHVMTLRQSGFLLPSVEGEGHRPIWDLSKSKLLLEQLSQGAARFGEGAPEWEQIDKMALRFRIPPVDIIRMRLDENLPSPGQLWRYPPRSPPPRVLWRPHRLPRYREH